MCELNLFIKTNKWRNIYKHKKLMAFTGLVTSLSYSRNQDGDGIYANGVTIKSKNKVDLTVMNENIYKSNFVLCHQRIATSGFTNENLQPFVNKGFVLVHNGILSGFDGKENESDTNVFFQRFLEQMEGNKKMGDRTDRIVSAIKALLDDGDKGSYSIGIYDIISKKLYYFRDSSRCITLFKNKDMCYLATSSYNGNYNYVLDEKFKEKELAPYRIYSFKVEDNKIKIRSEGKIKSVDTEESDEPFTLEEETDKELVNESLINYVKDTEYFTSAVQKKCSQCQTPTYFVSKTSGKRYCEECIKEDLS